MISMFSIWQIQLLSLVAFHRCPEHWLKTRGGDRAAILRTILRSPMLLDPLFSGSNDLWNLLDLCSSTKEHPVTEQKLDESKSYAPKSFREPKWSGNFNEGLLSELSLIFACPYIYRLIEGAPYCVTFKYKSETSQVIDIKYHISHGNTIYHTYYHISHGNTNKIKVKSHRSRKVGLTLPATTLVDAGLAFVPGIYMSRTNTILKNMQPLLNYLVLIAPAIPTVSNSLIPLNPTLLVFVIVVSPTSSTILPNHGALRAICDYSAADDLVGFHVAHPVVLPSCHPPLPRTIYWASCRVNIVVESEGEEKEQRSFENHLKSTSTSSWWSKLRNELNP